MLNEWSDRDPDPPGRSGCAAVLAVLVGLAVAAFIARLLLWMFAD